MRSVVAASAICLFGLVAAAGAKTWLARETVHYAGYSLIIQDTQGTPVEDDFPRLKIVGPRGASLVVSSEGGLVPLAEGLIMDKSLMRDNKLASAVLYASPHFKDAAGAPFVIVLGRAYASDPGSIRVIALKADGVPTLAFSSETFEPSAIADLDNDGTFELIGRPSYSQSSSNCLKTYDPFAVYRVSNSSLRYSEALSRRYNIAHYYGWAGPKAREDVVVVLCGQQRGKIMNARDAEALTFK
jgi:hypothetical protein